MRAAEVILDIPTASLDTPYTYIVADDMDGVKVGVCVLVPFGHRKAVGLVTGVHDVLDAEDSSKLKSIEAVVSEPYFSELGVRGAEFVSNRYIAPLSISIKLFTPPGSLPKAYKAKDGTWQIKNPTVSKVDDRWVLPGENFAEYAPKANATKQLSIMDALSHGEIRVTELNSLIGSVAQPLKALEKVGAVKIEHRRRLRGEAAAAGNAPTSKRANAELTSGQAEALRAIDDAMDAHDGRTVLVDGVTGSGKTEVYLQAIERALEEGKGAIVLVPEISLTPQTVARFRGRFGDTVAVMHSKMSQGERFDQWEAIRVGDARVVVGARSALFTPVRELGLIVIDEEHEGTYKQENAPRYVTRDVAEWMAQQTGATLVLGSATPSIEALRSAKVNPKWTHVVLPERVNGKPLPKVEIIDMTLEFKGGSREIFSKRLKDAMVEELAVGHKVVLLLNQRGFSKFLLCRDCGFVPECKHCSTTLTYHEVGNRLVCHHCGYEVGTPAVCPSCGSPYLKRYGAGTQRVEAELASLFESVSKDTMHSIAPEIIRMDADTTTTKGSHQDLLERFAAADSAVLLGTQMIAKGLDFDDVTLVGVINADTQLHLPDFRAGERTFDLIQQVAGRAGRAELDGKVLIQTYEAASYAIRSAALYDRELFLRNELPKRKALGFPPFVRMANILIWGKDERQVEQAAASFQRELMSALSDQIEEGWEVLPASKCAFERIRDDFRWHIIIKTPVGADISTPLFDLWKVRKIEDGISMAVDVDPVDVL